MLEEPVGFAGIVQPEDVRMGEVRGDSIVSSPATRGLRSKQLLVR